MMPKWRENAQKPPRLYWFSTFRTFSCFNFFTKFSRFSLMHGNPDITSITEKRYQLQSYTCTLKDVKSQFIHLGLTLHFDDGWMDPKWTIPISSVNNFFVFVEKCISQYCCLSQLVVHVLISYETIKTLGESFIITERQSGQIPKHSQLLISQWKLIPNYSYLKVNFLGPENLL